MGRITKASTALTKGRDLLARSRWTRRASRRRRGTEMAYCALGALDVACVNHHLTGAAGYLHTAAGMNIVTFNDRLAKSKQQVLSVYDKAIALAKADGR